MIFAEGHIEQILDSKKTQTRRLHMGYYEVGRHYSIQKCRTCKGIEGYRIVIDDIRWEHTPRGYQRFEHLIPISIEDALAEGGYTPEEFEKTFKKLNPEWSGMDRFAYKFHVIWTLITKEEKKRYRKLKEKGYPMREIENIIRGEREVEAEML